VYKICKGIAWLVIWFLFGLEVKGLENIPKDGSAVIAANHVSWMDPVAVGVAVNRPICFMAKNELFRNSFSAWFLSSLNAFPVKRGQADRNAIRTGLGLLEKGRLVGIFPEGTRGKNGDQLSSIQSGAAFFSIKSQAPIIPVVVKGTDSLCFRRRISVTIGKPIKTKGGKRVSKEELISVNNMILQELTRLGMQEFD